MKVCFLGSSQLYPMARGWRQKPGDVEATFMAAPGALIGDLTVTGGKLVSSGRLRKALIKTTGVTEAPVEEFDAISIVGLHFSMNLCARLFASRCIWQTGQGEVADESRQYAVRSELLTATRERLSNSVAVSMARKLRPVTSAPLLLVAPPGLSERVIETDLKPGRAMRRILAGDRQGEVRSIYDEACNRLGGDFEIVPQPAKTVSHEILTDRRYDSTPPGDPPSRHFHISHMNTEYGLLAMRELLDRL